jgi:hypothetical protein
MPQGDVIRVVELDVQVPAGTLPGAPLILPWNTYEGFWDDIELVIPDGHNGTTGIRILKGDVSIIPWGGTMFIVASGYQRVFPIGGHLSPGDLKISAYNQGFYPHTFYLRATIRTIPQVQPITAVTESSLIGFTASTASNDPLSPDAILGSSVVANLASGAEQSQQALGETGAGATQTGT